MFIIGAFVGSTSIYICCYYLMVNNTTIQMSDFYLTLCN
jgi:hypothetical protein